MLPPVVKAHLTKLGVGDAGVELIELEIEKAIRMTRDELKRAIETKHHAIRLLRIQQAVYLAVLEESPDQHWTNTSD